jgi:hypothetical protein
MLGNIDIVQKVAEIATKNNSQHICENILVDLSETLLTKLIQSSPIKRITIHQCIIFR